MDYFTDNREMVEELLIEVRPTPLVVTQSENSVFNGSSFCVTGSFESISRDEIHTKIEENGGEVRTSVSPKLNYLIVGSDAGSKLEKAKEFGVKVLGIEEFLGMLK